MHYTRCLKRNRTSETFYCNFAKIALIKIGIYTHNLHMTQLNYNIVRLWCIFLAQHKLLEKLNVVVSARCSWLTAADFTLSQSSVSQLL